MGFQQSGPLVDAVIADLSGVKQWAWVQPAWDAELQLTVLRGQPPDGGAASGGARTPELIVPLHIGTHATPRALHAMLQHVARAYGGRKDGDAAVNLAVSDADSSLTYYRVISSTLQ